MLHTTKKRSQTNAYRQLLGSHAAFTLVEMLVAVTLVLLMMSMFAQVFQIAGDSISKQRGMAENDQRSRTLQTIFKADLDKRSNRWVYPFAANENLATPESLVTKRQGYFYVSENNPYNPIDDVLQFTVASTIIDRSKDQTPYYGRALFIPGFQFPNQPDADDAQLVANNTGLSTVAEVVYFVRNGNLYRRMLLLREPLPVVEGDPQPNDGSTPPWYFFRTGQVSMTPPPLYPTSVPYATTFWADYDYTAYYTPTGAVFLGTNALDNNANSAATIAISHPARRFGFSPPSASSPGRPKEFAGPATGADFIGRMTLEECSHPNFGYPHFAGPGPALPTDPTQVLNTTNLLDPFDKTLDDFRNGPRRGEDLLIPNVVAFDIQVWDARAFGGSFVNIGDPALETADLIAGGPSDYALSSRNNSNYGPRLPAAVSAPTAVNAVFDTWHPNIDLDGNLVADNPPFHPVTYRPTAITGGGTMYDMPSWQPNFSYVAGKHIVFPASVPAGWPFYYRCIKSGTSVAEPTWPKADGLTVSDGTVVWQAVDNRKPLRAIRIEVRFVDPSTQQMRQMTIIHSLVD